MTSDRPIEATLYIADERSGATTPYARTLGPEVEAHQVAAHQQPSVGFVETDPPP